MDRARSLETTLTTPQALHNKGHYRVVDLQKGLETGTFLVDTRLVTIGSGEQQEWELMIQLKPDNQIIDPEDEYSMPDIYRGTGHIIRLLDKETDPLGEMARKIHNKAVELAQSNTPGEQLIEELDAIVQEFRDRVGGL